MKFCSALLLLVVVTTEAFVVPSFRMGAAVRTSSSRVAAPSSTTTTTAVYGFFQDLFSEKQVKETQPEFEAVTMDPDFRVAALFLGIGAVLDTIPYIQLTLGPLLTALGVLFLVQTFRIRFRFDESNHLELVLSSGDETGENVVVGGANRWDCNTIVNYDFFPQSWMDGPVGPMLVYFKETQTPQETWNEGPGKLANDPDKIAAGKAVAGQVHFFPAVCNAQQIRAEFEKRNCRKL